MVVFTPRLEILPPSQRNLWKELDATPEHFTLYGGTALALYLGHRQSVDFDFFSHEPFDPDALMRSVPYLNAAEPLEISPNSLTCRVDRGGKIKMRFFGGLSIGRVEPRLNPAGASFWTASLLDVAGTKVKVLPERSEEKDYIDVDALLKSGVDLPTMLGAAKAIYGQRFNPLLALKGLTYFVDVPKLPEDVKERLTDAAVRVDLGRLPVFTTEQPGAPGDTQ
jgi:hypothetical protein